MQLQIHTWPNKILRKKCKTIPRVDARIKSIFDSMCALMEEKKGVGLAANQAGLDISLIVVAAKDRIFKLANPKILRKEGKISFTEGCLSFPGIELSVKRAAKIWVSGLNENNEPVDLELDDLLAIIFQHEIDHVNGMPFIYRVPFWKRWQIMSGYKKYNHEGTKNTKSISKKE